MIRLFFALRSPPDILDELSDLMDGVADARWQDDEQLHLTLRFVGEVERPTADDLVGAFQAFRGLAATVRLRGVGAFGGRGRSGALWVGVEPRDAVAALHRKLDQLCVRVGLAPEGRAFTPHVTVARLPRGVAIGGPEPQAWLARHAAFATEPFAFDRVLLFRSHLGRHGASYEEVAAVGLSD